MEWVSTLLTSVGLARDLSWAFACPSHCGSNSLPSFVAGLGFGLSLGFCFGLWLCIQAFYWIFREPHPPHQSTETRGSPHPRVWPRLAGYLMSDQRVQVSAKDISDLVKSVQDLTLVVTRIAQDSERSRSSQRLVLRRIIGRS